MFRSVCFPCRRAGGLGRRPDRGRRSLRNGGRYPPRDHRCLRGSLVANLTTSLEGVHLVRPRSSATALTNASSITSFHADQPKPWSVDIAESRTLLPAPSRNGKRVL